MAIFEETMYGVQCDSCGKIYDDGDGHNVWPDKSQAFSNAQEWNNWIEHEGKHYCPECYEIDDNDSPMTVKIKEFMALYGILDIKMRMLRIPELKRIMGFPENYKLIGTQAEQKKYIGNAVEVNMARVLCEALARKIIELKSIAA